MTVTLPFALYAFNTDSFSNTSVNFRMVPPSGASTTLVDVLNPPSLPPLPFDVLVVSHDENAPALPAVEVPLSAIDACSVSIIPSISRRNSCCRIIT